MHVMRVGHFWQFDRNYRWGDSSSFLAQTCMASEAILECLILTWGSMPPDPPSLFTLMHTQWPYQSKIAGVSPAVYELQVRIGSYGSTVCNEPHQSRPR